MWLSKKQNKVLPILVCCVFVCLISVCFATSNEETVTPPIVGEDTVKSNKIINLSESNDEVNTTIASGLTTLEKSTKAAVEDPVKESNDASKVGKKAQSKGEKPREIVFALDNSGSMKKNDPNRITKEVVSGFIKNLKPSTRLGMVIFDSQAKVLEPLTPISDDTADKRFIESLDLLDYRGQQTNTPMGIERAIYELKTNGHPNVDKMIILLTDGIIDTGDRDRDAESERWLKEDLVSQCRQLGIRIYGIAFTDQADFRLMQMLASKTNGEYFRVYKPEGIHAVFDAINNQLDEEAAEKTDSVETDKNQPTTAEDRPTHSRPISSGSPQEQLKSEPESAEPKLPTLRTETSQSVEIASPQVSTAKSIWDTLLILFLIAVIIAVLVLLILMFKSSPVKVGGVVQTNIPDRSSSESRPEVQAELIDVEHIIPQDSISLPIDKASVSIGRDSHNDIVIPEKVVSSLHATITFRNGDYYLEDNRSTNGTRLNNQVIEQNTKIKLKSGDIIHFAKCEFRFLVHDQAPYGETMLIEAD